MFRRDIARARRVLKQPPFEVTEVGWGEFDIQIKVHFASDANIRPVEVTHFLKLYPKDQGPGQQNTKKPVVNEIYHELIFTGKARPFCGIRRMGHRHRDKTCSR